MNICKKIAVFVTTFSFAFLSLGLFVNFLQVERMNKDNEKKIDNYYYNEYQFSYKMANNAEKEWLEKRDKTRKKYVAEYREIAANSTNIFRRLLFHCGLANELSTEKLIQAYEDAEKAEKLNFQLFRDGKRKISEMAEKY